MVGRSERDVGAPREVAICSLVRDGMAYLPSYRRQLESLSTPAGLAWRLYVLEGDSRDGSQEFLRRWAAEDARVTIGQEHVGDATAIENRAARWARVGNACFDLLPRTAAHTHVLWLEADLCFPPELLERLLARRVDVVAPVIWLGGLFYDTWGFRGTDGAHWTNKPPYHADYRALSLVEVHSVGSCVLFERKVLDAGIRFKPTYEDGLLVGMCNDARARGWRVWADTATAILHPVSHWEAQMWRVSSLELDDGRGGRETLDAADAEALGAEPNVSNLDAGFLARAHRSLWAALYRRLDTNCLEVDVRARGWPTKRYDLRVRRGRPAGLFGAGLVRRPLLALAGRPKPALHAAAGAPAASAPERTRSGFLPRPFHCTIRITLEDGP